MTLFTASDARRRFGRLLKTVQREPVTITKNGRAAAMMLSVSDKELIAAVEGFLEERYWGERIAEAERGGYIGAQESNRILSEALNAQD
jgi:prevent-host-death family protein